VAREKLKDPFKGSEKNRKPFKGMRQYNAAGLDIDAETDFNLRVEEGVVWVVAAAA
jgi:hypothetical protein